MLTIDEIESLPFLFIVGRGRSGTTLLQTMLDANPHVILPLESRLIIFLKKKYLHVKLWTPKLIEEFIIDLYKEKEFNASWNVDKEGLQKTIHSYPLNKLNFQVLCKIVYLSYPSPFKKTNFLLIGDKKPLYSIFINEIREVFPQARFIHLIRDYRDNILSNREVFSRKNIGVLAHAWKTFNIDIEKAKVKNKKIFYTVRYEDLVTSPEKHIREICDFTSIPFYSEMMSTHTKMKEVYGKTKTPTVQKLHSNMLTPINTNQINKWEKKLTKDEIALADYICGSYAKQYNYNIVSNKTKTILFLNSFFGKCRSQFDNFIVKTYYKLPFKIRDFINLTSAKLFQKFGFTNYYNHADFMFKKQEKTT